MTMQVERIASRAELAPFERDGIPAVIVGGARALPAVARWNARYLIETLGTVPVRYKRSATHQHPNFHAATLGEMFAVGSCTFGELITAITTGPAAERAQRLFTGDEQFLVRRRDGVTTVSPELAPLLADVALDTLVAPDRLYTAWTWFSGPGVRTWLHYDNNACHNLNAQITGRKECWLYPPDELARLAPFPLGGKNPAHNCSAIDVEAPPPGFADVPRYDAMLEAGDLLFIPAWWSHSFLHLGELNSNVNAWYRPAHPVANATARRHDVLELAAATGVDPRSDAGALLRQLDALAIGR